MLLAIKGSVCWSPSTAPAPRTVLAVLRRTGRGDERVRHLPAREGMPQLHGEDRLERADGSEAQEPADGGESSPLPPRRRCSVSAHDWGLPHSSQPLLQRSFDLPGTCSRVLAVSPARERPGSRSKICREWSPQLDGAKVNALSGFRSYYSWNIPHTQLAASIFEAPRTAAMLSWPLCYQQRGL